MTVGTLRIPLRNALRGVAVVAGADLVIRLGGRALARRLDRGTTESPDLRRVRSFGLVRLTSTSQHLSCVRADLLFAGLHLDLRTAQLAPGGLDLTVTCIFAGGDIALLSGTSVHCRRLGLVGVSRAAGLFTLQETAVAEVRLTVRGMFGGVRLTT